MNRYSSTTPAKTGTERSLVGSALSMISIYGDILTAARQIAQCPQACHRVTGAL